MVAKITEYLMQRGVYREPGIKALTVVKGHIHLTEMLTHNAC